MSALICGSMAYDTIMVFPDQFKNHILPDKVHILNVSFLVPRMRREFGGCAGNIAYNLKLLGGDPIPMATAGQDFGPYRERFERAGHHARTRQDHSGAVHAAGVHHHRPRQQPDHRVPSGRDDAQLREPREGRAGRDVRHRQPRRPRRHAAERAGIRRRRHSLHLRSGPGHAAVQRRGTAQLHRAGRLRHRQRLRVQPAAGTHRLERERHRQAREGLHHHARPARLADPHAGNHATTSRPRTNAASPIRRAAATPSAPA